MKQRCVCVFFPENKKKLNITNSFVVIQFGRFFHSKQRKKKKKKSLIT